MPPKTQQFRIVNPISEVEDIRAVLEKGFEKTVQTNLGDFRGQTQLDGRSPQKINPNHNNYSKGKDSERKIASIYGLGPDRSPANSPPDLACSSNGEFNGSRRVFEVKSCDIGKLRDDHIRPGSYKIPIDSHDEIRSMEENDPLYIMTSRIPDEENRLASIAILGLRDIDMLKANDDLPGISKGSEKSRDFLYIQEPIVNRVANLYNHSNYPDTGEGYSEELEDDFRKSFDRETVEYWFEHPENSVKSQRKYEA